MANRAMKTKRESVEESLNTDPANCVSSIRVAFYFCHADYYGAM